MYVEDRASGILAALLHGQPGEIYNLGGSETISLARAIQQLAKVLEAEPVIRHEPARPGDQRDTRAYTAKAKLRFGYQATVDTQEGLARQATWHAGLRTGP